MRAKFAQGWAGKKQDFEMSNDKPAQKTNFDILAFDLWI
jgi:hypothetical protein